MASELIVRAGDGVARAVKLEGERVTVGRAAACGMAFPEDSLLSRQHLALELSGDGWSVVDLGSRNGTTVNGEPIAGARALRAGDEIGAGRLKMEYRDGAVDEARHVEFVDRPEEEQRSSTVVVSLERLLAESAATQMTALVAAGRELVERRPLEELFGVILNLAADAVRASRGVLMLREGGGLAAKASKGSSFQMSRTVRDRVMEQRESLLIGDVRMDEALRMQASIVTQRIRSIIAVPLQTREKVIGLLYLDSPHMISPFTREDLNLITVMANIAAIRIETARLEEVEQNERLMAREMAQAAEIQKGLLPRVAPGGGGLEVAGFSEACLSCGGDFYDFYEREGRLVMIVADVAGKGMPAALLMTSVQARVQVLVEEPIDLAALVTRLNRNIASNCPGNRFVTFFICEVDRATGEMTYVNAGHNPPLVVRRDGRVEQLEGGGMILGIFGQGRYELQRARLGAGDVVAMFSDGVTEAQAPGTEDDFGEERLVAAMGPVGERTPAEMIEGVKRAVAAHAGSVTSADDFTLVVARKG